MTKATIAGGALAVVAVLFALAAGYRGLKQEPHNAAAASPAITPETTSPPAETHPAAETQGFLYGRVTTTDGATYEGRLRWGEGGDQEAFWGDTFNGSKRKNSWLAQVPREMWPKEHSSFEIFGFKIAERESAVEVRRQLVVRFGDVARVEADGRDVQVTLKSGSMFVLDRFEASDLDDGVRVWDRERGVVDLDSLRIRAIDLLPTPPIEAAPDRLYGTVRTRDGDFTGFVVWDRDECVGTDELEGRTHEGRRGVRFDTIRSIAQGSNEGALVTLLDGSEITLELGENRGVRVDDRRYGRVWISWEAFERVDFGASASGSGPAYENFPPGRPLTGSVTTRAGARLTGRLVYDLDEGETTETLDSETGGVDYAIPFGLIASIVPRGSEEPAGERAKVTLQSGEELQLEHAGDLGQRNAGMLIFVDGRPRPEYVRWTDVRQVDFDRPPAMYPPIGGR
jgi:hypothetical protein